MSNTLVWNCRGADAQETNTYLHDMISHHNPCIITLLEARVHSTHAHRNILSKTYLTNIIAVEAVGFVGGLWLMWDAARVSVELISAHDQILTILVCDDK